MILVCLENCKDCDIAKKALPGVTHITLKKKSYGDFKILSVKRALHKLKFGGSFPIMMDDDMTQIVPTSKVMANLSESARLENYLE